MSEENLDVYMNIDDGELELETDFGGMRLSKENTLKLYKKLHEYTKIMTEE